MCYTCQQRRHIANVCHNNPINTVQVTIISFSGNYCEEKVQNFNNNSNFSIYSVADEHFSPPFTLTIEINEKEMSFLLDSSAAC